MGSETSNSQVIPVKKSFDFVDTIRCISMIGIVFEHCARVGDPFYVSYATSMFQASVMQFFKFATIAFFLIAGFLINHKFAEYSPVQYIKNRFKNTIGPWAFWLNILVLFTLVNLFYKYFIIYHRDYPLPADFKAYLGQLYYETIFLTGYWFILNFLICICILLIFKKYIYKIWLGLIFALISLFYSVNLYHGWVITNHTVALFGFVFYLWLGAYMNKHFDKVMWFIERTSIWWIIGLTALFFLLGDIETVYLKELGSKDAYNTLRVSNILYSLSFFVLLLKMGPVRFINERMQPRKTTFGIYLIHLIIIIQVLTEVFRPFKLDTDRMSLLAVTGYSLLLFVLAYISSFIIVWLIGKTKFKWSIGMS